MGPGLPEVFVPDGQYAQPGPSHQLRQIQVPRNPRTRSVHQATDGDHRCAVKVVQLSRLRELCLRNNELTTLPESIGQLGELRHIDLRGNPLSIYPTSSLGSRGCRSSTCSGWKRSRYRRGSTTSKRAAAAFR